MAPVASSSSHWPSVYKQKLHWLEFLKLIKKEKEEHPLGFKQRLPCWARKRKEGLTRERQGKDGELSGRKVFLVSEFSEGSSL